MELAALAVNTASVAPHPVASRGLFVALFAVFLLVAFVGGLLHLGWRDWLPGAEGGRSLLAGVRSAVDTTLTHLI